MSQISDGVINKSDEVKNISQEGEKISYPLQKNHS